MSDWQEIQSHELDGFFAERHAAAYADVMSQLWSIAEEMQPAQPEQLFEQLRARVEPMLREQFRKELAQIPQIRANMEGSAN